MVNIADLHWCNALIFRFTSQDGGTKGKLISEWLFDFLNFQKKNTKKISALECKKGVESKDKYVALMYKRAFIFSNLTNF